MLARITQVLPVYPSSTYIQWTIEDPDNAGFTFEVLHSGSPSGPFEVISRSLPDSVFSYMDTDAHHFGLSTHHWYSVKVTPSTGPANSFVAEPKTVGREWAGLKGRLARKARRDLQVTLEKLSGVPFLAVKRKRFGVRCHVCFNSATKDVVFSGCENCYSTSFEGGYHAPVRMWGKIDPAVIAQRMDPTGITETSVMGITMPEYPLMEPEDLMVEIATNRRFVVKQKAMSESRRVIVHQDLQVSELSRSDTAYKVPLVLVE